MAEVKELKKVLKDTKRIIKHHQELTIAKGDYFNLFSVLKIETRENNTHSAFLAELLNPEGSHKMDDVFLKLFLETIRHEENLEKMPTKPNFESSKAQVNMEFYVGKKIVLEKEKADKSTGGRIDIYLKDLSGNIISIENKIHAVDQEAQIQRYCNHETDSNAVYYLTLHGDEPSKESKLKLESGKDFYNISYKNDIIAWLELCLKEVPNFTALREAINQYILLIKKLTNTLDEKHKEELTKTMLDNLLESQYIADNLESALNSIRDNFRKALEQSLREALDNNIYIVREGNPIHMAYAQLWIDIKGYPNPRLRFGVETFSGKVTNHVNLFVGILDEERNAMDFEDLDQFQALNKFWPHHFYLLNSNKESFNLRDIKILEQIRNNKSDAFEKLVSNCSEQIVTFVNTNTELIKANLNKAK